MERKIYGKKTKEYINLALYRLMLKLDYEEISVKDICEKAGISRMSFYRYYNKKDDIFVEYCDEKFAEFFEQFSKIKEPTLEILLYEVFKFVKENQRQLQVMKKANRISLLLEQFEGYAKYTAKKINFSNIKAAKESPQFGAFIAGGIFNVITNWLNDGMIKSPEIMANEVIIIFRN